MLKLCIADFAATVGGQLIWSSMPPLAGGLEPVKRIVLDSAIAKPGDVYWSLREATYHGEVWIQEAFSRGALGAVIGIPYVEPWAGKFVLRVEDTNATFCRFVRLLEGSALRGRSPIALGIASAEGLLRAVARHDEAALGPIIAIQRKPDSDHYPDHEKRTPERVR